MISNEERREIAARLRTLAHDNQGLLGAMRMQYVVKACTRILGTAGLPDCAHVFMRYADLIDPVCDMDVIDTGEEADYECSEHIMHCRNCGAEFGYVLYGEDGDVSMDDKPMFCPNCGARVVSE